MGKGPVLSALLAGAFSLTSLGESEATACGGFVQPVEKVDSTVTAHRMIFSISTTQTTLYDQINFSGSPSSFGWVLPIRGTAIVGLSADILFDTVDQLTATTVNAPVPPCSSAEGGGAEGAGDDGGGVTVISHQQVGAYETVQLKSSDGSALTKWLADNGYSIPAADEPVISAYVAEGMNFLAMKLVPGAGISAMQPVRITTAGASLTLPLRMVGVGTGPKTSITLWIVAEGRWEPKNFSFFSVTDKELTWDWRTFTSNYDAVRQAKESALDFAAWQVESSLELNQHAVLDAVLGNLDGEGEGGGGGGGGYLPPLPPPDGGSDGGEPLDASLDGNVMMTTAAEADLAVLFAGIKGPNVRVTRLRTDMAHSAFSKDLDLKASSDSSELSNQLVPAEQIHLGCSEGDSSEEGEASGSGSGKPDAGSAPSASGGCSGCSITASPAPLAVDVGAMTLLGILGSRSLRRRRRAVGNEARRSKRS